MRPEERDLAYVWDMREEASQAHPETAWRQIIGQRNVLAHEYGDINVDRIWTSATVSVPQLLKELEKLLID